MPPNFPKTPSRAPPRTVQGGGGGPFRHVAAAPARSNVKLYTDLDPLQTARLREEGQAAGRDERNMRAARTAGCARSRPRCRANGSTSRSCAPAASIIPTSARWCGSTVSVVVEQDGRQESGSFGGGGRGGYETYIDPAYWQASGGRSAAPGAGQSGIGARARRRDDGGAGTGLARHSVARSDRPWAGRRFQPQEDVGLCRAAGRAGRRARRHGGG